jgi:hypothetical protein
MSSGDLYLEMAFDLMAEAAIESNAVRRAGLEALAESYTHMGEQANGHMIADDAQFAAIDGSCTKTRAENLSLNAAGIMSAIGA